MTEEVDYEGLQNASLGVNMMAGALAGISEHVSCILLIVIKTRMQVFSAPAISNLNTGVSSEVYKTMSSTFRAISTTEGTKPHAVYFGTYEMTKEAFGGNQTRSTNPATGAAGSMATIASDALMNLLMQRMQIQGSKHKTALSAARAVYQAEGLRAFYISYPTTLTMSIPFTAVQFSTYEELKRLANPVDAYSPITHVVCGGISGAFGAAVTTPLDVCKTLLQTKGTSTDPEIRNCRGMLDACKLIHRNMGLKGFTRGIVPRVLTFMPSNALYVLPKRNELIRIKQDIYIRWTHHAMIDVESVLIKAVYLNFK
ncbi:hypothetical protein H4Q26_008499 [Puccinia striiformis f. sp. tritici PST-130]|nr:hypothetical protein H4Q26_008499 [Puccinia striiformis f. sp. tritici PST-130]